MLEDEADDELSVSETGGVVRSDVSFGVSWESLGCGHMIPIREGRQLLMIQGNYFQNVL